MGHLRPYTTPMRSLSVTERSEFAGIATHEQSECPGWRPPDAPLSAISRGFKRLRTICMFCSRTHAQSCLTSFHTRAGSAHPPGASLLHAALERTLCATSPRAEVWVSPKRKLKARLRNLFPVRDGPDALAVAEVLQLSCPSQQRWCGHGMHGSAAETPQAQRRAFG